MQYIIFGVIAIVGLVFLIIYNLRMDAKHRKAQAEPEDAPPLVESVQEKASDDARLLVEDARSHGTLVADAVRTPRTDKDKTTDLEYREALRTFHSVNETGRKEENSGEPEETPSPVPPVQKADDQFREALRSMKK
ncbi:hypothetical protein [Paenibacillus rigui]|uniref:Uncharacterized protein n=1 Tax=Paenibacillus rigui TaxID=554312 RepID=A0A229UY68_9BACL|nr:hypothetical protein [Paenibacillus rigui]OXM88388.1 hypothetical protein CF651_00565 [Paenibacillus rigui]